MNLITCILAGLTLVAAIYFYMKAEDPQGLSSEKEKSLRHQLEIAENNSTEYAKSAAESWVQMEEQQKGLEQAQEAYRVANQKVLERDEASAKHQADQLRYKRKYDDALTLRQELLGRYNKMKSHATKYRDGLKLANKELADARENIRDIRHELHQLKQNSGITDFMARGAKMVSETYEGIDDVDLTEKQFEDKYGLEP